jgi:hypothetical protein
MIIARGLVRTSRKFFGGGLAILVRAETVNLSAAAETGARERFLFWICLALGHVRLRALEVLLNHLHLVFDPQFELLETDFFHFFVVCQISFFDERTETL